MLAQDTLYCPFLAICDVDNLVHRTGATHKDEDLPEII